jgi:hypothetical protein
MMKIRHYQFRILRRSCATLTLLIFLGFELAPPPGHGILLHVAVVLIAVGAAATWYSTRTVTASNLTD